MNLLLSEPAVRLLCSLESQPASFDAASSRRAIRLLLSADESARPLRGWWGTAITVFEHARTVGHPPNRRDGGLSSLESWVKNQRRAKLDELKIMFLNEVPGWEWEPRVAQWNARLAELRWFCDEQHRAPRVHAEASERSLARWMHRQLARGRDGLLPRERFHELCEVLGPLCPTSGRLDHKVQA